MVIADYDRRHLILEEMKAIRELLNRAMVEGKKKTEADAEFRIDIKAALNMIGTRLDKLKTPLPEPEQESEPELFWRKQEEMIKTQRRVEHEMEKKMIIENAREQQQQSPIKKKQIQKQKTVPPSLRNMDTTTVANIYTSPEPKDYIQPKKYWIRYDEHSIINGGPAVFFRFLNIHKKKGRHHNDTRRATMPEAIYIRRIIKEFLTQKENQQGFLELNLPESRSYTPYKKHLVIKMNRRKLFEFYVRLSEQIVLDPSTSEIPSENKDFKEQGAD